MADANSAIRIDSEHHNAINDLTREREAHAKYSKRLNEKISLLQWRQHLAVRRERCNEQLKALEEEHRTLDMEDKKLDETCNDLDKELARLKEEMEDFDNREQEELPIQGQEEPSQKKPRLVNIPSEKSGQTFQEVQEKLGLTGRNRGWVQRCLLYVPKEGHRPFTDLPNDIQWAVGKGLGELLDKVEYITYNYTNTIITKKMREFGPVDGTRGICCNRLRWLHYRCTSALTNQEVACDTCALETICARIIWRENDYELCLFPQYDNQLQYRWNQTEFWIR